MEYDLYNELMQKSKELDISVKSLRKTGNDYAEAVANYRMEFAKELIRLEANGCSKTLATDIAKGKAEIAKLKYKELSTEAIYRANLESINAIKIQIKILQNQIDKEWGNNE